MEENKKEAPLEHPANEELSDKKSTDGSLTDEQLDNAVGGTAEPNNRLEDVVDNRTIAQPIDLETI